MLVDSLMLAAVVHELQQWGKGSTVRAVKAAAPFTIAVQCHHRQRKRWWFIASAHTRFAHIGWQKEAPSAFGEPHPDTERFAETVERHLEQAVLLSAEQVDFDRLVVVRFGTVTPLRERKTFALWCEVMGKHSNLVLVDEGTGLIVDALKRLPSSLNRYREVLPGKPYLRPPTGERRNPLTVDYETLMRLWRTKTAPALVWLGRTFFGMSDALLTALQERFSNLDDLQQCWEALVWLRETIASGSFELTVWRDSGDTPVWCYPLETQHPVPLDLEVRMKERAPQFGPALTAWLRHLMVRESTEQLRQSLLATLQRHIVGVESQLNELQQRWQEAQEADRYRHWGELLLTFAHQIPADATEAVVTDYSTDPPQELRIPIPEGKTPVEAAQHYFTLYRKLKSAAEALPTVRERLQRRLTELQSLVQKVQTATESELEALRGKVQRVSKTATAAKAEREGAFLRFVVAGGYEVWLGRNAEANWQLLRSARPDDLWLHVKGAPGSHALLRVKKRGEEVPIAAIEQAAQIAAYFSKRRTSSWVEVDYTRARYVRPAKGQKGMALYTNFKTVAVTPRLPDSNLLSNAVEEALS